MSLEIFKKWCGDEKNLLIIPGFCVSGTVGAKVLSGQRRLEMEDGRILEVKMQVKNMSFSAHADARGIMQMINTCQPKNVILVHGEASKMTILKAQIIKELGIPCFDPPNGQMLLVESGWDIPVRLDPLLIDQSREELEREADSLLHLLEHQDEPFKDEKSIETLAMTRSNPNVQVKGEIAWTLQDMDARLPPKLVPIQKQ